MKLIFAAAGAATVLLAGTASAQIVLPSAQQGEVYSAPLTMPPTYMSATYTAVSSPAGLSITGSNISGTPTTAGVHNFTVNASGYVMSMCMIPGPPPDFTPMPMPCSQPASTVQTYQLQVVSAVAPAAVPTMSEWAMILLGVLLAGGAALTIQRRRASV